MIKSNSIRDTKRLCAGSRDLIDQTAAMISESDAALRRLHGSGRKDQRGRHK
jgi:hypothetical protein